MSQGFGCGHHLLGRQLLASSPHPLNLGAHAQSVGCQGQLFLFFPFLFFILSILSFSHHGTHFLLSLLPFTKQKLAHVATEASFCRWEQSV